MNKWFIVEKKQEKELVKRTENVILWDPYFIILYLLYYI